MQLVVGYSRVVGFGDGGYYWEDAAQWVGFVGGGVGVGGVGFWVICQINLFGQFGVWVNFMVDVGDTFDSLVDWFYVDGIIINVYVFREYVKRKGGLVFWFGYYMVCLWDNMGNIVGVLRMLLVEIFQNVMFLEGFMVIDMVKCLLMELLIRMVVVCFFQVVYLGEGVVACLKLFEVVSLEGLLFLDIYQVVGNEIEVQVVKRMADCMDRIAMQLGIDKFLVVGYLFYQVLIVVLIIEWEVKVDDDWVKIFVVIWNWLCFDVDLFFEIDVTLFYQQDLKMLFVQLRVIDTFYNIYLYKGLPIMLIVNFGVVLIRAVLYLVVDFDLGQCCKGDLCCYLYYVLVDVQGCYVFVTNLKDYEVNVVKVRVVGLFG